jgi:hypothetical protein
MLISRLMIQILSNIQNVQEGKRHKKKRHQIFKLPNLCGNHLSAFIFVPSVFGRKFPTAEF